MPGLLVIPLNVTARAESIIWYPLVESEIRAVCVVEVDRLSKAVPLVISSPPEVKRVTS
jgi:hypothetical protein